MVDFAITSHIQLFGCKSWILVSSEGNAKEEIATLQALHFHCKVKNFPDYIYAHIIKTADLEKMVIKSDRPELTF